MEPHGRRLTLIVNDFGSVNIDASLLQARSADTLTLQNGCVCCTLSGGLAATLARIVRGSSPPDAIILEASGVAEPHGIVQLSLADPAIRLDGVVAVADAETFAALVDDPFVGPTVTRQISAADLILLNKIDLVDASTLACAEEAIRSRAISARILPTVKAAVPLSVVAGLASDRSTFLADIPEGHTERYTSTVVRLKQPVDAQRLCALAADLPQGVLRAKGVVVLARAPHSCSVLQIVGRRWDLEPAPAISRKDSRSEIVVIGLKNSFDAVALEARFRACESLV
jgi:G3E family GTPase